MKTENKILRLIEIAEQENFAHAKDTLRDIREVIKQRRLKRMNRRIDELKAKLLTQGVDVNAVLGMLKK